MTKSDLSDNRYANEIETAKRQMKAAAAVAFESATQAQRKLEEHSRVADRLKALSEKVAI